MQVTLKTMAINDTCLQDIATILVGVFENVDSHGQFSRTKCGFVTLISRSCYWLIQHLYR